MLALWFFDVCASGTCSPLTLHLFAPPLRCRLEEKETQLADLGRQKANLADQLEVMQVRTDMGAGAAGASAAGIAAGSAAAAAVAIDLASLNLSGSDLEKVKALEKR